MKNEKQWKLIFHNYGTFVELQRISIPRIVLKRLFLCRFVAFNFRDEVDIGRQHILTVRLLNSADLISSTQINDARG